MMLTRRSLLSTAAALSVAACARGIGRSGARSLNVATFNIWHDREDWPARLQLLVAALRAADADVIALQEVLQDEARGLPNQAETLAKELGGYSVRFVSPDPEGAPRRYGNAILTRLPILDEASVRLEPLDDYRTALRIRVEAAGKPVDIVATHLAWQPEAGAVRAQQVKHLLSWLPQDNVPLIVMGDFNAPLPDPGLAALGFPRFESALPPGAAATTLNTAKGHAPRVIDHIYVERAWFAVSAARVIGDRPANGVYPSDHFGVAADLQMR
jgi:endonuclease/exonuclease/phosphatase family metal-dependent hydrolase